MSQFPRRQHYPRPGMDELIFVTAVDDFYQRIVIRTTHRPGGSSDFMLSKTLIIDNADILQSVVSMVNQASCFLRARNHLVECLQRQCLGPQ